MANATSLASVAMEREETLRTNCVAFVGFTVLIWDHIDTFMREVEYIWKRKKGYIDYLFLLNRYLTPLGFIINLFAYLSPVWTVEMYEKSYASVPTLIFEFRCGHFVRFEGSMTVIGIHVVAIMMLIRINALYKTRRHIVGGVFLLFMVTFCVNAWLLAQAQPVVHSRDSGVHACTMIFTPNISPVMAASSAFLPLIYDSVVFVLTMLKTVPLVGKNSASFITKRLLEDGLLYYVAIFSVTLALTIMIVSAPPGLKNIAAQLELLLTVTMMSRITLNLKECGNPDRFENSIIRDPGPIVFQSRSVPGWPATPQRAMIDAEIYATPADW
ncbi:hypothetical protein C8R43DRAFT_1167210 [Mycena crocata]|nr:hypothetical protein C8R43DRAFT_1167210 [Mycena crocata]